MKSNLAPHTDNFNRFDSRVRRDFNRHVFFPSCYGNAGRALARRLAIGPFALLGNRVAMTECKGEPNRSVQRSNFPSVSTAKAWDMPKPLKELWRDSSGVCNLNSEKLAATLP